MENLQNQSLEIVEAKFKFILKLGTSLLRTLPLRKVLIKHADSINSLGKSDSSLNDLVE